MNKPFDREAWNPLERPLSSDENFGQSYSALALKLLMQELFKSRTSFANDAPKVWPALADCAFIGSAFKARALGVPAMAVTLDAGLGLFNDGNNDTNIGGIVGVNDPLGMKPLVLTPTAAEATVGITGISVPGGSSRLDYIEVKVNRFFTDSSSRDILNPITGQFNANAVSKTLSYALDNTFSVIGPAATGTTGIVYKMGPPGGAAPAIDPGYVVIAAVNFSAGNTVINPNQIIDVRRMLFRDGLLKVSGHYQVSTAPSQSMIKLEAPPGVEACVFENTDGGGFANANIFIKAGDARVFSSFSGLLTILGNLVVRGPGNTPDVVLVASASGGDQASAAAASPPMQLATGQAFLKWSGLLALQDGGGATTSHDGHFQITAQI